MSSRKSPRVKREVPPEQPFVLLAAAPAAAEEPAPLPEPESATAAEPVEELVEEAGEEAAPAPEVTDEVTTVSPDKNGHELREFPVAIAQTEAICIYCGRHGTVGETTENGTGKIYVFHNLPLDPRKPAKPGAVCLNCAKQRFPEHRRQFSLWFNKHRYLPLLGNTLENQVKAAQKKEQERQAVVKAGEQLRDRLLSKQHDLELREVRKDIVCSEEKCGRYHGQIKYDRNGNPWVTIIEKAKPLDEKAEPVIVNPICRDCAKIYEAEMENMGANLQLYWLGQSHARAKEIKARREEIKRLESQRTQRFEDLRSSGGPRYYPKGDQRNGDRKKTGTNG